MSWMKFNRLSEMGKVISDAEGAASIANKLKLVAQAGGLSGAKRMLYGMGDFGEKTFEGLYAARKETAFLSGKYLTRVLDEVIPKSKNPIKNNLMFRDMWHLAEQRLNIFDNNVGTFRDLTPGETTAYIRSKYINKPSSDIAKYTDAWDEVQKRTQAMRTILDDLHAEASDYAKNYAPGTILEYLDNYMPHSWEYDRMTQDSFFKKYLEQFAIDRNLRTASGDPDILEAKRIYEQDIAPKSKFIAENLVMKRTADMPGYDMSPIAIMNYIDDAAKQMSEWKHLGEDYNKLPDWLSGIEQDAGIASRDWAEDFINTNLGRTYAKTKLGRTAQDISTVWQQGTSLIMSYFSVLRNAFQSQFAAFATDIPSYGKGIARVFKDNTEAMKFAQESRVMQFNLPKSMNKSWPGRVYQGAITDFWAGEMGFARGGQGMMGLVKNTLNGLQQWHYKMIGMNATERYNRSISANSALEYLDEIFQAAKGNAKWYTDVGGQQGAIKRMRELIDLPNEQSMTDRLLALPNKTLESAMEGDHATQNLVERARAFAAWQVVDDTQYGLSGRMRLPLLMQHPIGKFLMQFKTFSYRSMQMIKDLAIRNPKHFLLATLPMLPVLYAEGMGFKELIKLLYPGNKREENDPGIVQRAIELVEPLAIMGVGDMFFEMIRDFAETGDATKALTDFFATPVAVKKAKQTLDVTMTNRWKKIVDWDYDFKKYFDMTPSEKSQFIRALPWPGPASAIQMGSSSWIKREAMEKEKMDKIMRDFLQRSGVMTRPTTPPRIRRQQLERQFRERF